MHSEEACGLLALSEFAEARRSPVAQIARLYCKRPVPRHALRKIGGAG